MNARSLIVLAVLFVFASIFLLLARPIRELDVAPTDQGPLPPTQVRLAETLEFEALAGAAREEVQGLGVGESAVAGLVRFEIERRGEPAPSALVIAFCDEERFLGEASRLLAGKTEASDWAMSGIAYVATADHRGMASLALDRSKSWHCFTVALGAVSASGLKVVDFESARTEPVVSLELVDVACLELLIDGCEGLGHSHLSDPRQAFRVAVRDGQGFKGVAIADEFEELMYRLAGLKMDPDEDLLVRHIFHRGAKGGQSLEVGLRGAPPGFEEIQKIVEVPLLRNGIAREVLRAREGVEFGQIRIEFSRRDAMDLLAADIRAKLSVQDLIPGGRTYEMWASQASRLMDSQGGSALEFQLPVGDYRLALSGAEIGLEANGGLPVRVSANGIANVYWEIPVMPEVLLTDLDQLPESVGGVFVYDIELQRDEVYSLEGADLKIAWPEGAAERVVIYPYGGEGAWAFVENPHAVQEVLEYPLLDWDALEAWMLEGEVGGEGAFVEHLERVVDSIVVRPRVTDGVVVLRPVRVAEDSL